VYPGKGRGRKKTTKKKKGVKAGNGVEDKGKNPCTDMKKRKRFRAELSVQRKKIKPPTLEKKGGEKMCLILKGKIDSPSGESSWGGEKAQ